MCGGRRMPPLAIGRVGGRPSASASRARPGRSAGCPSRSPSSGRAAASTPRSSPGRSTPVGRAEAEPVDPAVEALGALELADLDRADVARAGQDLRGRERFFGVFGVVVDRAVGDLDLVGDVEAAVGRDQALLQRARDRDRLEGGAGFVVEADGAVLERVGGAAPGSLALTCGQLASARIAPLRGSITIAVASFGLNACATAPSTSSVRCWMLASSVSSSDCAGHLGVRFR